MNKILKYKYKLLHGKVPAYIHIPKTGGTYLGQRETSRNNVISPVKYLGHCVFTESGLEYLHYPPSSFKTPFTLSLVEFSKNHTFFTTTRNIYDWLVSYWHHAGGVKSKYQNKLHYDYNIAQKGFENFVNIIASRKGNIWPSKKFIFFQAFSYEGTLLPEWISRTSTLDNDLKHYSVKKKLKYEKKRKQRVSGRNTHYTEYYSKELQKVVHNTWRREIELYGFKFGSNNLSKAIIKKDVTENIRNSVKYVYNQDKLYINGKLEK